MQRFVNKRYLKQKVPEHIWLGVSVEDSVRRSRIDHLRDTNAAIRFLSIEPLIGSPGQLNLSQIQWVILGGESGPNCRTIEDKWVRSVRDQCIAQKVPFFFKQWGGFRPKSGGRELDGREWNEFPILSITHTQAHEMYSAKKLEEA